MEARFRDLEASIRSLEQQNAQRDNGWQQRFEIMNRSWESRLQSELTATSNAWRASLQQQRSSMTDEWTRKLQVTSVMVILLAIPAIRAAFNNLIFHGDNNRRFPSRSRLQQLNDVRPIRVGEDDDEFTALAWIAREFPGFCRSFDAVFYPDGLQPPPPPRAQHQQVAMWHPQQTNGADGSNGQAAQGQGQGQGLARRPQPSQRLRSGPDQYEAAVANNRTERERYHREMAEFDAQMRWWEVQQAEGRTSILAPLRPLPAKEHLTEYIFGQAMRDNCGNLRQLRNGDAHTSRPAQVLHTLMKFAEAVDLPELQRRDPFLHAALTGGVLRYFKSFIIVPLIYRLADAVLAHCLKGLSRPVPVGPSMWTQKQTSPSQDMFVVEVARFFGVLPDFFKREACRIMEFAGFWREPLEYSPEDAFESFQLCQHLGAVPPDLSPDVFFPRDFVANIPDLLRILDGCRR